MGWNSGEVSSWLCCPQPMSILGEARAIENAGCCGFDDFDPDLKERDAI